MEKCQHCILHPLADGARKLYAYVDTDGLQQTTSNSQTRISDHLSLGDFTKEIWHSKTLLFLEKKNLRVSKNDKSLLLVGTLSILNSERLVS